MTASVAFGVHAVSGEARLITEICWRGMGDCHMHRGERWNSSEAVGPLSGSVPPSVLLRFLSHGSDCQKNISEGGILRASMCDSDAWPDGGGACKLIFRDGGAAGNGPHSKHAEAIGPSLLMPRPLFLFLPDPTGS